jgi:xanthine dehydrogenase accessory factor
MHWIEEVSELYKSQTTFVMATLIESSGSSPRDAGARMFILPDGSTRGTIGGGCIEAALLKEAMMIMGTQKSIRSTYHYPQGGCGGSVTFFLESVFPGRTVVIFGGGHIGYALATILAPTSFHVRIIEERLETLQRYQWPKNVTLECQDPLLVVNSLRDLPDLYCLIAGFSAHHDEKIVMALKETAWCYLGVLGSRTKGEHLKQRLIDEGLSLVQLKRFHCPAGLENIGNKLPGEIAISIAAQILRFEPPA